MTDTLNVRDFNVAGASVLGRIAGREALIFDGVTRADGYVTTVTVEEPTAASGNARINLAASNGTFVVATPDQFLDVTGNGVSTKQACMVGGT